MALARKALWALSAAGLALMVLATVAFAAATIGVRVPYWGEAEVVFEASRLREHLPLFVDPLRGATEYGAPPSRWYVTYPPLWTAVVALAPKATALVASRVAATLAWFGALVAVAWTGRKDSRPTALACAAFVAGSWVLANFATTGRPDAIACALAAAGLARAARLGRVDPVALGLLVLVPWVKPTILGLPTGAFVGDRLARGRAANRTLLVAIASTVAIGLALQLATSGQLFADVVRSNAQPFAWAVWMDHVPSRLPFFGPLFVLAGVAAYRDRFSAGTVIAASALVASVAWTLVALAKTGSASNYWMEPCVAAVVVVAYAAPAQFAFGKSSLAHAALAAAAIAYAGVASVRASFEHAREYRADARFVEGLRGLCGGAVAADEAGIELAANGRVLVPTYQMAYLARAGAFPASTWIDDLRASRCVVEHSGQLRLVPAIDLALAAGFTTKLEAGGFRVLVPSP